MRLRTALLLTAATAAPAAAGPCRYHADNGYRPVLLTPDDATLDRDGGVVVAAVSWRGDAAVSWDPSQQDWLFGDGATHVVGVHRVIAPGLVVHAPAATVTAPALAFEDETHHSMLAVHHAASAPPTIAPAPKVRAVNEAPRAHLGIMHRALVTAELAAPPPADAVALVVYAGTTARSWTAIDDHRKTSFAIYAIDDCVWQLDGTIATVAGDRVSLAWLDATGHLSARSTTVRVTTR